MLVETKVFDPKAFKNLDKNRAVNMVACGFAKVAKFRQSGTCVVPTSECNIDRYDRGRKSESITKEYFQKYYTDEGWSLSDELAHW